jgi:hypothetical protein
MKKEMLCNGITSLDIELRHRGKVLGDLNLLVKDGWLVAICERKKGCKLTVMSKDEVVYTGEIPEEEIKSITNYSQLNDFCRKGIDLVKN